MVASLEDVAHAFHMWKGNRNRPRYPEAMWNEAVNLARSQTVSIHKICKALGVSRSSLMKQIMKLSPGQATEIDKSGKLQDIASPFVEIIPEKSQAPSGVEIYVRNSRIHLTRDFDEKTLVRCLKVLESS